MTDDIYSGGNWFKCSKDIVKDESLSRSVKWLYVVLSCLSNTYANNNGVFTRTNEDLQKDCGFSPVTLKKAKKELIDAGYIKVWRDGLWRDDKHVKITTFHICYYVLLK